MTVAAVDDGIRGKDYTVLLDGAYTVTAGGDGVKSDNETDEGRGWLLVSGGALTVNAWDDGVRAFSQLTVTGGTVYTGGTASVTAGLGDGTLYGGQQQGTVTVGEYTAARGPGGR